MDSDPYYFIEFNRDDIAIILYKITSKNNRYIQVQKHAYTMDGGKIFFRCLGNKEKYMCKIYDNYITYRGDRLFPIKNQGLKIY
jgi:hypothetical protein